jgi:hypothetical protein
MPLLTDVTARSGASPWPARRRAVLARRVGAAFDSLGTVVLLVGFITLIASLHPVSRCVGLCGETTQPGVP